MKSNIKTFLTLSIVIIMMNCSSSADPIPELTAEEKQMNMLAKTWKLGTVTYGDEVITDRFSNFLLTLTKDKSYAAAGNLGDYDYEPFKASGSWGFKDGNLDLIERNDNVVMGVQVTESTLELVFTISEANGRLAGLGAYHFEMVPQ